jgi:catechol 2,3-dioxygenase-like lactoylglutathione lyase family enzyme
MLFDGIDMVILPVADLATASAQFERLGLVVSPVQVNPARGSAFQLIPIGGPDNLFCIELLSTADAGATNTPFAQQLSQVAGKGLSQMTLRVIDLPAALAELGKQGITAATTITGRASDGPAYEVAILEPLPDAAATLGLIQWADSLADRHAAFARLGQHAFPLKRVDHLAAVAPDLDTSCAYWDTVLGVPTIGEVKNAVIVVRQLKIGDVVFELLGPGKPDSPISQRPPGLGSSVSFEVPDLKAAIAQARAAGFDVPDHRIGTLPGTIVTTISSDQLSGLTMQLLQYT